MNDSDINILCELLCRIKNCLNTICFYNCTNININHNELNGIKTNNKIIKNDTINSLLLIDDSFEKEKIKILSKNNTLVCIHNHYKNEGYYLNYPSSKTKIDIYANWMNFNSINIPNNFKVLAIIHVYNEEDVIEKTVNHLLNQGIDVYILDNWSKDKTWDITLKLKEEYPNRIFIEKFPNTNDNCFFDWYHQLEKTESLSKTLDYNWFIHYDADEYRITPWNNITLKEMIYYVDKLGFNIIENTLIIFRITNNDNNNIFMEDTYYEYGTTPGAFIQFKTWKKDINIKLKETGGHKADISDPKVFPLKILNRHYPLRSLIQAEKKIFTDRKLRFSKKEIDLGWHIQYNSINDVNDIIFDKNKLLKWNSSTLNNDFISLFFISHK